MPRHGRHVTVQRPRIDARTLLKCHSHNIHHNPIFKSKINETSMDNDSFLIFSLTSYPVSATSYIRHRCIRLHRKKTEKPILFLLRGDGSTCSQSDRINLLHTKTWSVGESAKEGWFSLVFPPSSLQTKQR